MGVREVRNINQSRAFALWLGSKPIQRRSPWYFKGFSEHGTKARFHFLQQKLPRLLHDKENRLEDKVLFSVQVLFFQKTRLISRQLSCRQKTRTLLPEFGPAATHTDTKESTRTVLQV